MGLYDEIRWDAPLPEGHTAGSRLFQTKSLDPCLDHYVVTPAGRLLLVGSGWSDDPQFEASESPPVDVEFHGDILLTSEDGKRKYVARFTHGSLEWIRELADQEPWDLVAAAHAKFRRAAGTPGSSKKD